MQHLKGFYRATASLAVLALLSFPSASAAQVYRCVDAAGKVTFSDQGCADGHSSSAIDVAPANTLDSTQYRSEQLPERSRGGSPGVRVTVVGGEEPPARTGKTYSRQRQVLPAPAARPAPGVITNCDSGGCWDSNGVRYNRGAGNTHFPANGGPACEFVGGNMVCP
ncbi:DUF4124 domain-containing protein [Pseudomonas aeruginosa]|uniref:DUF4124 domain-containing protein n=1 Tax=Pseudomonas aeruginosa TaxID=287 RepID=UPI003D9C7692